MFDIDEEKSKDLIEVMGEYNIYLSILGKNDQTIWTQPYEDAFGFGQTVSVVHPVYSSSGDSILGVIGIDVTINEIEKNFKNNAEQISKKFLK